MAVVLAGGLLAILMVVAGLVFALRARRPEATFNPARSSAPAQRPASPVPPKHAEPRAVQPRPTPASPTARRVAPPVANHSAPPLVLIVDDSAIMRRTLERLFGRAGYGTVSAEDGDAALRWVRQHGMPALITLDMEMPRRDGLETLRALNLLGASDPVRAMFVTTRCHERIQETASQLGALAFFSKPYDERAMLALARRVAPLSPAAAGSRSMAVGG